MKKYLAMLLCTAALLLNAAMPALAANQQYPISVESFMEGDNPQIRKVYQLSLTDDPSTIPTGDFERDGRLYYLLDITRTDQVGVDVQTHTETVTLDSDTGELSEILQRLDGQMEIATEDGYTGVLILDHTSVTVEVTGYNTSTRNVSATRTYADLSDADLSLIPTSIEDSGRTLTLADVQWSGDGLTYTATVSYTGTSSSRYATGYTVTANYTGEVAKTNCDVITYTAIFGSMPLSQEEPEETPEISETPEPPEPEESKEPEVSTPPGTSVSPLLLGAIICGGGVLLGAVVFFALNAIISMNGRKRNDE